MNNQRPRQSENIRVFNPKMQGQPSPVLEDTGHNDKPMNRKKKSILIVTALLVVFGVGSGVYALTHSSSNKQVSTANNVTSSPGSASTPDNTIRILAAGDFISHDSINAQAKNSDDTYNYMPMMDSFTKIFQASDVRFCNDANLNGGTEFGITGYPKFNSPTEFARDMGKVGCNMVNTGTNHSFDKSQREIDASVAAWEKLPNMLAVAGQNRNMAEHDAVHYFTVKGVKMAFLTYTTYLNLDAPAQNDYGVNVFSKDFASKQITEAKANGAKYIITSIRWGVEYSPDVSAEQTSTAQWLSDQGVNLVLGHGSHVLQPVDEITGNNGVKTTVFYSLGNFLNTQIPPETLINGLSVINLDPKTMKVISLQFLPIYTHYEWTADQAKQEDLLKRRNIKMYLFENTTQAMLDSNQLNTTLAAQKDRLQKTLNTNVKVDMISSNQYLNQ